jgi:hypothetical protein
MIQTKLGNAFRHCPNFSLPPRKAVGSEFSAQVGLAGNTLTAPNAKLFVLMLPARLVANSLLECPLF